MKRVGIAEEVVGLGVKAVEGITDPVHSWEGGGAGARCSTIWSGLRTSLVYTPEVFCQRETQTPWPPGALEITGTD